MELWYRKTYRLAPTDKRFLSATPMEMLTEYYAYHFDKLHAEGKLDSETEDDDFDLDQVLKSIENDEDWDDISP